MTDGLHVDPRNLEEEKTGSQLVFALRKDADLLQAVEPVCVHNKKAESLQI